MSSTYYNLSQIILTSLEYTFIIYKLYFLINLYFMIGKLCINTLKGTLSYMERKIAFFDIDGTLTSEIDGTIPESAVKSIQAARKNGHLMFLNTGRCMQNVEQCFRNVGFDGYVCGCGTNIYCTDYDKNNTYKEILYVSQSHNIVEEILFHARKFKLDLLFESKYGVCFDMKKPLITPGGIHQHNQFILRNYDMSHNPEDNDFVCDKFVVWFSNIQDLNSFRSISDKYFECIDRGGNFREFVPIGYSKATGIQVVLDYYHIPIERAYAFGDSNNDLSMLSYVPNSIAMGNATPTALFNQVSYVTTNASKNGIENALKHFHFIN